MPVKPPPRNPFIPPLPDDLLSPPKAELIGKIMVLLPRFGDESLGIIHEELRALLIEHTDGPGGGRRLRIVG